MILILPKSRIILNKLLILIVTFFPLDGQCVNKIFKSLTLEEKIGQLFVIPVAQALGEEHLKDVQQLILQGRVGGILLKQGTAQGQKILIEKLQRLSPLPLLCLQDGEYGVAMRLSDVLAFPCNLTLGAVQDLSLLYELGQEIGRQCSLVGVHINLAPVVDVNSNPLNPIIHTRSFGEDPFQVAKRAERVMQGMQSMGIFACLKHFPGHGDTSIDSHVELPYVNRSLEELQRVELFPFSALIRSGAKSVMSAHLCVRALSPQPATFSHEIITTLLQKELKFQGLVISDALNMKALANNYSPGEIALNALLAGHDLLLYGDHIAPNIDQILRFNLPEAFDRLKAAVENHEISEEIIDRHVSKIIQAKQDLGLFEKPFAKEGDNVAELLNSPAAYLLKKRLFEEAITMVCNEGVIPLAKEKIALIELNSSETFKALLKETRDVEVFSVDDPGLLVKIQDFSCLVVTVSQLQAGEHAILHALAKSGIPAAAILFGTPYQLAKLPQFAAVVVAYENAPEAQEAAAQVLLGKLSARGKLPVRVRSW